MCINETGVTDCLINKLMSLHISIDCFAISIDCFGVSRIKKWVILIIIVNWDNFCSGTALASRLLHISETQKTVSSDQPAQKQM